MHELLAPLIFVLHCDHQAFLHACEIETIEWVFLSRIHHFCLFRLFFSLLCFRRLVCIMNEATSASCNLYYWRKWSPMQCMQNPQDMFCAQRIIRLKSLLSATDFGHWVIKLHMIHVKSSSKFNVDIFKVPWYPFPGICLTYHWEMGLWAFKGIRYSSLGKQTNTE